MCDLSVSGYNEHLRHPGAEWLEHIRSNRITSRLATLSFMKAAVNILRGAVYLFRYFRLVCKKLKPICGNCHYSARYPLTELPRPWGSELGIAFDWILTSEIKCTTMMLIWVRCLNKERLVAARRGKL